LLDFIFQRIVGNISIFSALCSKFVHKQTSLLKISLSLSDFDRNWNVSTSFIRLF